MTENIGYFSISKRRKVKFISPNFVYAKLLLIYAFLYTLAFASGCFIFHALDAENSIAINSRINAYLSADFLSADSWLERANLLLEISASDVSHLIIIFTAGFTLLVGIIISLLLIFRGFSLGFSISYFTYAIKSGAVVIEKPNIAVVLFSLACAFSAAIMIHFSVKTTCFSDDFKALGGIPRRIIKSRALYSQLLRFLIALGAVLILNMLRCIL